MPPVAKIALTIFDGTRNPISPVPKLNITILDGRKKRLTFNTPSNRNSIEFQVPFFDNTILDSYTVVVSASKYEQAGIFPVVVSDKKVRRVDVMLLPKKSTFRFSKARWDVLKKDSEQRLFKIFRQGEDDEKAAERRYNNLIENKEAELAAILNITEAIRVMDWQDGSQPLDYFKGLIWDDMQPDRFFAWADKAIVKRIEEAARKGLFKTSSTSTHHGATQTFKQTQFNVANVQLALHENDTTKIGLTDCIKVEADIDYHKDLLAHFFLELIPNAFGGDTNPRSVYLLRWIASRNAGITFDPPFTIEA
ncbi:MAG TPA: hypothetical protein VF666_00825 [Pyrinomonadaceae bacterium]|jgi:hypothetical protein